jgi:integrase
MAGRPRLDIGTYGAVTTTRVSQGCYRAQTRFRDDDGRVRKVLATGPTSNAAVAELKRRLRDREGIGEFGEMLTPDSPFTVLASQWLGSIRADAVLARGTKQLYETELRTLLLPAWQGLTVREVTASRVERFIQAQRAESYAKAKHSKTLLRMVMAHAVRHGAAERNPVAETSRLRRPVQQPKSLTPDEIERIREAARTWRSEPGPGPKPDGQVRDLIEVMLGTATRIGEALALRRCDVDVTASPPTVTITGTIVTHKGKGAYRQPSPKTAESNRPIAIPAFAAEVIRRRLAATAGEDAEHLLFFSRTGNPLWPNNVRRTFREILQLAGLEGRDIRPHSFRKTGATLISAAAGEQAASEALGHTSVTTTKAHYIERTKAANPLTAEALESLAPDAGRSGETRQV